LIFDINTKYIQMIKILNFSVNKISGSVTSRNTWHFS